VFVEGQRLSRLAAVHPIVAKKVGLLMAAYELLDGRIKGIFDRAGVGAFRSSGPPTLQEGAGLPATAIPAPVITFPDR
jgi:hypothetical protein